MKQTVTILLLVIVSLNATAGPTQAEVDAIRESIRVQRDADLSELPGEGNMPRFIVDGTLDPWWLERIPNYKWRWQR